MDKNHLIGIFNDEFSLVRAVEEIKGSDIPIEEVYTPYPVHEVIHAMGRKSYLQVLAYFYGLFGALATLGFLYWACVINWPVDYGGKPFNSFPSFIIVTIVITIFIVTIASLATFSGRAKLWPGKRHRIYDPRATDDRFVIVVNLDKTGKGQRNTIERIFKGNGALEIRDAGDETGMENE